jgi:aspartate-semialdehyde dehydrogenase
MTATPKRRFALVGTESLRGKELKNLLNRTKFPLRSMDFFDADVAEEFSKLTDFQGEPKVIHHPSRKLMEGLDIVFLASDSASNREFGLLAAELDYRAIDLVETFNADPKVPLVVAGINDAAAAVKKASLVANPNPAAVFLSRLLFPLRRDFGITKAVGFVLRPASAFEDEGIRELVDQSCAILSGSTVSRKVFRNQVAFNVLSRTEKPGKDGFSAAEKQVAAEVRRVLGAPAFPFTLSIVQAPVFHTYSLMVYVELDKGADLGSIQALFKADSVFRLAGREAGGVAAASSVAGKDEIVLGEIKAEPAIPGGFWFWVVADNLTAGSALNALAVAKAFTPASRADE